MHSEFAREAHFRNAHCRHYQQSKHFSVHFGMNAFDIDISSMILQKKIA